jgi:hypothetical protein
MGTTTATSTEVAGSPGAPQSLTTEATSRGVADSHSGGWGSFTPACEDTYTAPRQSVPPPPDETPLVTDYKTWKQEERRKVKAKQNAEKLANGIMPRAMRRRM